MNFTNFQTAIYNQSMEMQAGNAMLFQVAVDKDEMWQHYLNSFPEGSNPIFRERTEHDCSCCRHFVKNFGHVVAIKNRKIISIWDVIMDNEPEYSVVAKAMSDYIHSKEIEHVWFTHDNKIGTKQNYEISSDGNSFVWDHFYTDVMPKFIKPRGNSIESYQSEYRSSFEVFKRALDELTIDATQTVLELIADNSLYRGDEWKTRLNSFLNVQKNYKKIPLSEKSIFCWENLATSREITHIRNSSMGTLLIDISNDVDLDTAVRKYEVVVAPTNYKRPKAIFTKKMLEDAQKTISELGYMNSLQRRYANLDDITANNILFCNRDAGKRIQNNPMNVFEEMGASIPTDPKKFNRVKEIGISDFINDVLPSATDIELFLENRLKPNMVSLIAPVDNSAPSMFKWNNAFGWAYSGNITDSDVKQNVKNAGGNVDGDLRFSIQWNDDGNYDGNDLDAHCRHPFGEIYYGHKLDRRSGGSLDIDIINPEHNKAAVENIVFPSRSKMAPGQYEFFVHCYTNRGGRSGFRAEIEFDGNIYSYNYTTPVNQGGIVPVATVILDKNGNFSIKEHLNSSLSAQEIWGITSNQFIPVSVMMYSPNYWDGQNGIGNRHYFFMLKNCVNPENPRGFFNEYLKSSLEKHKRVFEALGSRMSVQETEDQLSGVGFSSTRSNHVIVKVKGNTERILKVVF